MLEHRSFDREGSLRKCMCRVAAPKASRVRHLQELSAFASLEHTIGCYHLHGSGADPRGIGRLRDPGQVQERFSLQ